jgi:hypothetical protein
MDMAKCREKFAVFEGNSLQMRPLSRNVKLRKELYFSWLTKYHEKRHIFCCQFSGLGGSTSANMSEKPNTEGG